MNWEEMRAAFALIIMLTVPGWAFLSLFQGWRHWGALQRWIIAVLSSICFYPILFYLAREVLPQVQLGERKILAILLALAVFAAWQQRKHWRAHITFSNSDWLAVLVFGLTIFTRLWMAHLRPYPAWSDSLHHTIITQLTAQNGQLPYTLNPYEPSSLNMYHLGLYAITGVVQLLAHVPATTALLFGSQFLNGAGVLGIYLALRRLSGERGALVGAVVAGLFSFQPAWYFNWGRFTQAASQAILPAAWIVTVEALDCWVDRSSLTSRKLALAALAAVLNAGTFLFHYRAAAVYLALLAISLAFQLVRYSKEKAVGRSLAGTAAVGLLSILLIIPALLPSLQAYINGITGAATSGETASRLFSPDYYHYTYEMLFSLGTQRWLFAAALLASAYGAVRKSITAWTMLLWLASMWLIGNAYRTGAYWLSISNYTGLMILHYLPFSILIGTAVELMLAEPIFHQKKQVVRAGLAVMLFGAVIASHIRVGGIEEYRYLLTSGDARAMEWVKSNIPEDEVIAINTYLWNGVVPHGSDGGYWLPYYAGRRTTTGTMMFTSAPEQYVQEILDWSALVSRFGEGRAVIEKACDAGVHYAFSGVKGSFTGSSLADTLKNDPAARILYDDEGVQVFELCPDRAIQNQAKAQ